LIPDGKKVIVDKVYGNLDNPHEHAKLSLPNACDHCDLKNSKACAQARHESFNGSLKYYCYLSDTFHHGHHWHVLAFEAVAVTIIYKMELGSPLFEE
jgi:hypothetical protein